MGLETFGGENLYEVFRKHPPASGSDAVAFWEGMTVFPIRTRGAATWIGRGGAGWDTRRDTKAVLLANHSGIWIRVPAKEELEPSEAKRKPPARKAVRIVRAVPAKVFARCRTVRSR